MAERPGHPLRASAAHRRTAGRQLQQQSHHRAPAAAAVTPQGASCSSDHTAGRQLQQQSHRMQPAQCRRRLNSASRTKPAPRVDWRAGEGHPDQLTQNSVILGSAGAFDKGPNSSRPIGVCMLIPSLFTGRATARPVRVRHRMRHRGPCFVNIMQPTPPAAAVSPGVYCTVQDVSRLTISSRDTQIDHHAIKYYITQLKKGFHF